MKTCYWLRRSPSREGEGEGPCERTNRNIAIICEHFFILPMVMQDDGSTQMKNTLKHCPNTNYSLCRILIICNTLLRGIHAMLLEYMKVSLFIHVTKLQLL